MRCMQGYLSRGCSDFEVKDKILTLVGFWLSVSISALEWETDFGSAFHFGFVPYC